MKTLLVYLSVTLLPLLSFCQQKEIEVDKLTGDSTISLKDTYLIGKKNTLYKPNLGFDVKQKKEDLILLIWGSDAGKTLRKKSASKRDKELAAKVLSDLAHGVPKKRSKG